MKQNYGTNPKKLKIWNGEGARTLLTYRSEEGKSGRWKPSRELTETKVV